MLKRLRMSPSLDPPDNVQRTYPAPYSGYAGVGLVKNAPYHSPQASSFRSFSPSSNHGAVALTPTASSVASEDAHTRNFIKPSSHARQESPDRRLSVSSLLSGPPGGEDPPTDSGGDTIFAGATTTTTTSTMSSHIQSAVLSQFINYGVDRGFPDLDLPNNNDAIVLNGLTPALNSTNYGRLGAEDLAEEQSFPEFGFGLYAVDSAHGIGGYYERPVTVAIPRSLGVLPATLQENPMNLLYFHHFLNHTASILVPHDCSENPFKTILPQSM